MCMLPNSAAGTMCVDPATEESRRLVERARYAGFALVPLAVLWLGAGEYTAAVLDALAALSVYMATKERATFINLSCVVNFFMCATIALVMVGPKTLALLFGQPFGMDGLADWRYKLAYPVGVAGLLVHAAAAYLGYKLYHAGRLLAIEFGTVGPGGSVDGGGAGAADSSAAAAEEGGFRPFAGQGYSLR